MFRIPLDHASSLSVEAIATQMSGNTKTIQGSLVFKLVLESAHLIWYRVGSGSWCSLSIACSPQRCPAITPVIGVQILFPYIFKRLVRHFHPVTRVFRRAAPSLHCRGNGSTPHTHIVIFVCMGC
jgi:hypothetical protein